MVLDQNDKLSEEVTKVRLHLIGEHVRMWEEMTLVRLQVPPLLMSCSAVAVVAVVVVQMMMMRSYKYDLTRLQWLFGKWKIEIGQKSTWPTYVCQKSQTPWYLYLFSSQTFTLAWPLVTVRRTWCPWRSWTRTWASWPRCPCWKCPAASWCNHQVGRLNLPYSPLPPLHSCWTWPIHCRCCFHCLCHCLCHCSAFQWTAVAVVWVQSAPLLSGSWTHAP